jgi:prevent-host-death family protein
MATGAMKSVTFTEFRSNASGILDMVEGGETVRVMRHGRPVANIVPIDRPVGPAAWQGRGLRLVVPGAQLAAAVLKERRSGR